MASVVAAGGWTEGNEKSAIYLFDRSTGEMRKRITGLPQVTESLVFSADGRYLAAGLHDDKGLRVYDGDREWTEVFRDEDYGDGGHIYGVAFAGDGRLATASFDGKVRLYDPSFRLIASQDDTRGYYPARVAFSPDGTVLAVGHDDVPAVDLLDGQTLELRPGPDINGLHGGGSASSGLVPRRADPLRGRQPRRKQHYHCSHSCMGCRRSWPSAAPPRRPEA